MRGLFGWDLPPGCGTLPGEESIPPSCDACPEEEYYNCPGMDNCIEVLLDSHPTCCLKHRVEVTDGICGSCEAEI